MSLRTKITSANIHAMNASVSYEIRIFTFNFFLREPIVLVITGLLKKKDFTSVCKSVFDRPYARKNGRFHFLGLRNDIFRGNMHIFFYFTRALVLFSLT